MNPLFHTEFSISDSLKNVRKSVLIYETIILNGALYGFDFDLTESEILLYNASKLLSPLQRIEKSFHKL